jgi:hypothetical protein
MASRRHLRYINSPQLLRYRGIHRTNPFPPPRRSEHQGTQQCPGGTCRTSKTENRDECPVRFHVFGAEWMGSGYGIEEFRGDQGIYSA